MLSDLMQHRQHGDVGFACTSRGADQQVLIGVIRRLKHDGLDAIKGLHPLKDQLADLNKAGRE